jgi:hypothetical protein
MLLSKRTVISHTTYVNLYQQLTVRHHFDLDDADRAVFSETLILPQL